MTLHHVACTGQTDAGHSSSIIIVVVLAICIRVEQIMVLGQMGEKYNYVIDSKITVCEIKRRRKIHRGYIKR